RSSDLLEQPGIPVIIETDKFTLKTGTQVGFTDEALVVGPAVKNGKSVDGRFAENRIIIFVGRKRERAAAAGSYDHQPVFRFIFRPAFKRVEDVAQTAV